MELFADFARADAERLLEAADDEWLAGIGAPRAMRNARESESADADEQMAALDADMELCAASTSSKRDMPVRLTMQLIRESVRLGEDALLAAGVRRAASGRPERCDEEEDEQGEDEEDEEDEEARALLKRKALRLDWLSIGRIENLDAFSHVQELYLQHNLLERVENLDEHADLRFLALAGNRIRAVHGLRHLDKLRFLDLSDNCIEHVDMDELPPSLLILRLAGNPFARHTPDYAQQLLDRFPSLVEVDRFRRDSPACASSSSSTASEEGEASARVVPLSGSLVFGPPSGFEDQVERFKQQLERSLASPISSSGADALDTKRSEAVEASNVGADATIDPEQYEQERKARVAAWKEQLAALATRKAELEEDARPVITRSAGGESCASVLSLRRSKALERMHEATDAALADAASHIQQMEIAHQEWQLRHQARTPLRS